MINLRDYQQEAVEAVITGYKQKLNSQLIVLPTGTGKTLIFADVARKLRMPTLVLAHREELLEQSAKKFNMLWPDASVGFVKGSINDYEGKDVVISSIQTLSRENRLKDFSTDRFGVLVCDEAHHSTAATYKKVFDRLGFLSNASNKLLLGVTATPIRGDGVSLGQIYRKTVFQRSVIWMIKKGYLVDIKGLTVRTKHDISEVKLHKSDYNERSLSTVLNTANRNEIIVDAFLKKAKKRKTICFAIDIKHVKDLSDVFKGCGISAEPLWGDMNSNKRKEVLQKFRQGEVQVLVNCGILTEGYDEPSVDCIMMARPTRSKTLYMQMLGRGLRLFPGKNECLVIDFADNTAVNNDAFHLPAIFGVEMHGQTLLEAVKARDKGSCAARTQKEGKPLAPAVKDIDIIGTDIFERSQFKWTIMGDIMRLPVASREYLYLQPSGEYYLVVHKTPDKTKVISNLLDIGYAQGVAEDWLRKHGKPVLVAKDAAWRDKKPKEGQVALLKKLGIYKPGLTRGEASDAVEAFFAAKELKKQRRK